MLAVLPARGLRATSLTPRSLKWSRSVSAIAEPLRVQNSECGERALDKIHLQRMKFFGYHGVLPEERQSGQDFFVSATLHVNLHAAGKMDDLSKTVNYADVFSDIEQIVEGKPCQLIETVAEAIADTILRRHPLVQVATVRVDKPQAPIAGQFDSVAVELTRHRPMHG